jgi:transcriptional regulator with XRE-family HTH domain
MEEIAKYNRIAETLSDEGRTQKWLAKKLGISANTMSNWCTQRAQPSLSRLFQIADLLSVDPCVLLEKKRTKK